MNDSLESRRGQLLRHPVQTVDHPTVSLVIPAMNEEKNLPHVAARMPAGIDEIILVDGNSSDETVSVARELWPEVKVVLQTRRGKGNALACGFAACTGDIIVMIDADCSTDPAEIPRYVGALVGGADFAKGSRFIQGGGSSDITRVRRWGNQLLNGFANAIYDTNYSDLCYGYNAFWRGALSVFQLPAVEATTPQWGDGFEIEALINVRVAAAGLQIAEVGSFEQDRLHGTSNLNAVSDGLRVLRTIWSEREKVSRARGLSVRASHVPAGAQLPVLQARVS